MDEQSNINQIEDYLMDALNKKDRKDFEDRLARDPVLAQELARRKKLIEGMEFFGGQRLKDRLKEIHKEVIPPTAAPSVIPPNRLRSLLLAGIAVALLLLLALWYWWPAAPPNSQDIYAAHYEVYDLQSAIRSTDQDARLTAALENYQKGDFQASLPLFESLLQEQGDEIQLLFGAAHSHLGIGQPAEAIPYLQRIVRSDDLLYKDAARWYLALSFQRLGQADDARALFEFLATEGEGTYQQKAQQVLKQLD
ncbi:MAG: hypothetical protein AAFV25_06395 [Bacteroidota bacterium]